MLGSPQDLLVIAAVGFILFGSKKLPEVAKSLGSSVVEFKKAMHDAMEDPAKKSEEEAAKKSETIPQAAAASVPVAQKETV